MADGFRFPLHIIGQTDVGVKRKRNEDSMRILQPKPGEAEFKFGALALVCDGMGGVGKGDEASKTAVEVIFKVYYDLEDTETNTKERLKKAITAAHKAVQERARELGMMYIGSTAAGLAIRPDGTAVVFNLGDSRAYRLRGGKFEQISKDQSVLAVQLERGEITEEQARASRNMNITAFIGHPFELDIVFDELRVEQGDVYVLCSDGLWDVVHEEEIFNALQNKSEDAALHYFIAETLRRGAPDNVTAIIISTRAPRRQVPTWVWGLVGLVGVASLAFLLMNNSVNTLTGAQTAAAVETGDAQTALAALQATTEATLNFPTSTPTDTATPRPTHTHTPSPAPTDTATQTPAPTDTATPRPITNTPTRRPSTTPTDTPPPSDTPTPTERPSSTPSRTPTATLTASNTPSRTPRPSSTPTFTPSPTQTATITRTPTTVRATRTPSQTPTVPPTNTPRPTDIPLPTSTLSAAVLAQLGTPQAVLTPVNIVPLTNISQAPISVYLGDITIVGAPRPHPTDKSLRLQLIRVRAGVLSDDAKLYYLIEAVEPQIEVKVSGGIILRQSDSTSAARTGAIPAGAFARVIGISPSGRWFLVSGDGGRGWVSRTLEDSGDIRFIGDLSDVPIVRPQQSAATPDPNATPSDSVTITPDGGEQPPEPTPEG
jgi:serine/threonine protein phosphatase PrpC